MNKQANNLSVYEQQTRKFRQIKQVLSIILGENLASRILVSNYKNSILYLETTSAAVATRFKMQQSQVLTQIRKDINPATVTIEMKISPKSTSTEANKVIKNTEKEKLKVKKELPDEVADIFTHIAAGADGELKQKLLKLAQHRRNKK